MTQTMHSRFTLVSTLLLLLFQQFGSVQAETPSYPILSFKTAFISPSVSDTWVVSAAYHKAMNAVLDDVLDMKCTGECQDPIKIDGDFDYVCECVTDVLGKTQADDAKASWEDNNYADSVEENLREDIGVLEEFILYTEATSVSTTSAPTTSAYPTASAYPSASPSKKQTKASPEPTTRSLGISCKSSKGRTCSPTTAPTITSQPSISASPSVSPTVSAYPTTTVSPSSHPSVSSSPSAHWEVDDEENVGKDDCNRRIILKFKMEDGSQEIKWILRYAGPIIRSGASLVDPNDEYYIFEIDGLCVGLRVSYDLEILKGEGDISIYQSNEEGEISLWRGIENFPFNANSESFAISLYDAPTTDNPSKSPTMAPSSSSYPTSATAGPTSNPTSAPTVFGYGCADTNTQICSCGPNECNAASCENQPGKRWIEPPVYNGDSGCPEEQRCTEEQIAQCTATSVPTAAPSISSYPTATTDNLTRSDPTDSPTANPTRAPTTSFATTPDKVVTLSGSAISTETNATAFSEAYVEAIRFASIRLASNPNASVTYTGSCVIDEQLPDGVNAFECTVKSSEVTYAVALDQVQPWINNFLINNQEQEYFLQDCQTLLAPQSVTEAIVNEVNIEPIEDPTSFPTSSPTSITTSFPTSTSTGLTTEHPSDAPSESPTASPSGRPTGLPSASPTGSPSGSPTSPPTTTPSASPSDAPSASPSESPSGSYFPSSVPTPGPSISSAPSDSPTGSPSASPTGSPTGSPSWPPSGRPSDFPTGSPSGSPTGSPSDSPTNAPTNAPTSSPTEVPTSIPTANPTLNPTNNPTSSPSANPSGSYFPSQEPSLSPSESEEPSQNPTLEPTASPTASPSASPSANPTLNPTTNPTFRPSDVPTTEPTKSPTGNPTTGNPTVEPGTPTDGPSEAPSLFPTGKPQGTVELEGSIDSLTEQNTTTLAESYLDAAEATFQDNTSGRKLNEDTVESISECERVFVDCDSDKFCYTCRVIFTGDLVEIEEIRDVLVEVTSSTEQEDAFVAQIAENVAQATENPEVTITVDLDEPIFTTPEPTSRPTRSPTINPTSTPTNVPTRAPTPTPTKNPTANPTLRPTANPISIPASNPTLKPTSKPTSIPTTSIVVDDPPTDSPKRVRKCNNARAQFTLPQDKKFNPFQRCPNVDKDSPNAQSCFVVRGKAVKETGRFNPYKFTCKLFRRTINKNTQRRLCMKKVTIVGRSARKGARLRINAICQQACKNVQRGTAACTRKKTTTSIEV